MQSNSPRAKPWAIIVFLTTVAMLVAPYFLVAYARTPLERLMPVWIFEAWMALAGWPACGAVLVCIGVDRIAAGTACWSQSSKTVFMLAVLVCFSAVQIWPLFWRAFYAAQPSIRARWWVWAYIVALIGLQTLAFSYIHRGEFVRALSISN